MSVLMVIGLTLWVGLTLRLRDAERLSYRPNVACMNGSPYGKVLVLIMQDPIETYVHKGARHGEAKYLKDDNHDAHADHHHDHDDLFKNQINFNGEY